MALLISPIFVAILLYMLGETNEHRKARIIEEEGWRRSYGTKVQQDNQQPKEDIVDVAKQVQINTIFFLSKE